MNASRCWTPDQRVGLVGYGVSIPHLRLPVSETIRVWGNSNEEVLGEKLMLNERAVLAPDEDAITLAIQAATRALASARLPAEQIGALYFGTCTNPYDSRPSATVILEALGLDASVVCADVQFGGKSGTTALQAACAAVAAGMVDTALAIGSDTLNRHIAPGAIQEYGASAGAAALIVGREGLIAEIRGMTTYASDLSDSFRVEGERYIRCGGWVTLETDIGLASHIKHAAQALFAGLAADPADYAYAAFQQPVGAVPFMLADALNLRLDQIMPGLIAYELGDCGSASALISLAGILDGAQPGERILLASYGFGAGSDAFDLVTTPRLPKLRRSPTVAELIADKTVLDYATAMKCEFKYLKAQPALSAWM